ncbi:MAG: serine/threonine-protein kinase [Planctomycetota bacterium]|nr:serine/threonine-protein kinase [Planctomycetota bacterium]
MKFTYSSGDRPLDGYTIKRGLGKGGFGEVYFAISDGEKEVALKQVNTIVSKAEADDPTGEQRGDHLVLNVSHANLVTLFDIKEGVDDDTWIIMEFMAGNSLRHILDKYPTGLSTDDAAAWFYSIASGVEYLHNKGIVHRDLKPGNVFISDGNVKVGDYGLSKFISSSQRGGHTRSIGTLHYMAPEIGDGNYGREIDVYALGIMLFELLTGDVPFTGETDQEILVKQLTAKPDLSSIPLEFRKAIEKALQKDKTKRYQHVVDMLRDIPPPNYENVGDVQRPQLPEDLETVDKPKPRPIDLRGMESHHAVVPTSQPPMRPISSQPPIYVPPIVHPPVSIRHWKDIAIEHLSLRSPSDLITELTSSLVKSLIAALAFGFVILSLSTHASSFSSIEMLQWYAWITSVITVGSWTVLSISKCWETDLENNTVKRFLMFPAGAALGLFMFSLANFLQLDLMDLHTEDAWFPWVLEQWQAGKDWRQGGQTAPVYQHYVVFVGILFAVCRWWKQASPMRNFRMDIISALMVALIAWLIPVAPQPWMPAIMAATVLSIQFSAPQINEAQRREFERTRSG